MTEITIAEGRAQLFKDIPKGDSFLFEGQAYIKLKEPFWSHQGMENAIQMWDSEFDYISPGADVILIEKISVFTGQDK